MYICVCCIANEKSVAIKYADEYIDVFGYYVLFHVPFHVN